MAHLEIKKIENFFYLFKASGCHLKYFVIWKDGENPYPYNWHNVRGEEPYEMRMNIDNINGIHFMFMMAILVKISEEKSSFLQKEIMMLYIIKIIIILIEETTPMMK